MGRPSIYSLRLCQEIFRFCSQIRFLMKNHCSAYSKKWTLNEILDNEKSLMQRGISLIAVVIVMLIISSISLVACLAISHGTASSLTTLKEHQALYIAEAGLEWYKQQLKEDADWSSPPSVKTDQEFGPGIFSVSYSNQTRDSIDITAIGKVVCFDGNYIQRLITQHIEKSDSGTRFSDFAIFFGGGDGSIETSIGRNQDITGDIFIHGDLHIDKNCTIDGDVSATGEITIGSGTYISGTVTEHANFPATQPHLTTRYYDDLITTASSYPSGNRTFNNETISGTIYVNGNVTIKNNLNGSGMIVCTGSVDVNASAVIAAGISIISEGQTLIRKNVTIGKNTFFYSSSEIILNTGIVLGSGAGNGEGVVLLSPGDITLGDNTTITGFVFGDDVVIGTNLVLTGNLGGNRLISLARGGVIIKDDTKIDYTEIEGFEPGSGIEIITSLWQEGL